MSVRFIENRRGGLTVDRDSLHESDGYKRQVEALKQLSDGGAVMGEKMTLEQVRDKLREEENAAAPLCYRHEYGAMADALDAHLTQPAQAVDVGAILSIIGLLRALSPAGEVWRTPDPNNHAVLNLHKLADKLTAALPNANGKEGES